jgi:F-box/leucine-rich repeat protein 14
VRLGDASLSVVAHNMPALAQLRATRCQRFTDRGVAHLPRLHASLLEASLGPLPGLTAGGLAHLAALTTLTRLELRGCPRVTNAGVAPLVALRRLSVLVLSGCRVDMDGVLALSPLTRIAQIVF